MKKIKKILWSVGIALLVLIVVAVIVVGLFLGNIAKAGIEKVGPKIVQVPVGVDAVNLSLLTGSAKVKGLVVGNPEGYKAPSAISVGSTAVGVNPLSVLSDKIVVRSVEIREPEITFEGGLSGNNLSKIMDNVNGVAKNGGPESTNKTATASSRSGKKIEVDDLLITGAKVHGTLILFGGKEVTIPSLLLPDIHLTNLGTGSDGITATDLTRRVLDAITAATIKAVAKFGTDLGKNVENLGKEGVNTIKTGIGGLLKKSTN
jgi:hypothetical protein